MASPARKPHDDLADAIPMNKTKPTTILLAAGAGLIVVGALVFTFTRGGGKKINPNAESAAAPATTMSPEETKRHLEITRKSLEAFEKAEAEKKQQQQQQPQETSEAPAAAAAPQAPKPAARPAGAVAAAGPARPAAGPARPAAPAPEPPPKPKKPKKSMSDLDGLGSDIAGQLGK
jgi:hypothetical protein